MSNRVANIHAEPIADAVYIGRGNAKRGLAGSHYGNPFTLRRGAPLAERVAVIGKYRDWLLGQTELLGRLRELRGRRGACYCHPLPCHGDVLVEFVDADEALEELQAAGLRPEAIEGRLRLHGVEKASPELVERARRHKQGILALLEARQPPPPTIDAAAVWLDAISRLQAEVDIPPEVLAELKAARVKFA